MRCCDKVKLIYISAKCSDNFTAHLGVHCHSGYVPYELGIGGGDYVQLEYCLNCGKIVGDWPAKINDKDPFEQEEIEE